MTLVMPTLQKHVISNVKYIIVICYFLYMSRGEFHLGYVSGKLLQRSQE